jgi:ABC-type lipoprotein export system ATPase subunit
VKSAARALRASRSARATDVAQAVETTQQARNDRRSRGALRTVGTDGAVVELIGVGRQYGSDPPVIALRDVDLRLERGASLAIVGPSGSGKSTLMNVLGCLDRPTSGTYLFEGVDVGTLNDDQRAALRAHRIGFVFQSFNLLGHRTVLENVMLAEVYRGVAREGRADRALATLARVGMTARAHFLPPKLSGGEQQRVAIARALMGDHAMLLCDEPTGNLDSANTESVLALFDELAVEGLTLVMVTHEDQVAAHAKRRVRMIDGRLTEETR